jgi:integrase
MADSQATSYTFTESFNIKPCFTNGTRLASPSQPDLLSIWNAYSDLLWENGKHKIACGSYIHEIHDIMKRNRVVEFDNQLLDGLVSAFRKKGNRNSTINRKLSALSKVLRKHQKNGQINKLPDFYKLPENNGRIRFLNLEEEDAIFSALHNIEPDYQHLAIVLVDTGARIGEALSLSWADQFKQTVTFWETKSKTPRTVPITQRVNFLLAQIREEKPSGPFQQIKYYKFLRAWNEAKEICGLQNDRLIVPHILRHTCASRLAQSGVDIKRIQDFLGHKPLQMTLRYAHLSPKQLDSCAEALTNFRIFEEADAQPISVRNKYPN